MLKKKPEREKTYRTVRNKTAKEEPSASMSLSQSFWDRIAAVRQQNKAMAAGLNKISSQRKRGASGTPVEDSLATDSPIDDYSRQMAPSPPPPIDEIEDYLGDPTDPIEMKRKVAEMLRKHARIIQALEKGKQVIDHRIDWLEVECARLSSEIDADIEVDQTNPQAILDDVDQQLRLTRSGVEAARAFHLPSLPPCVPEFISNFMNFLGCYIVAFILLWRLTLVVLPTVSLLVIPGLIYGPKLMELSRQMGKEYNRAVAIVEQAISSVRTVYSFGAELRTTAAFSGNLDRSVTIGLRQGLVKGLAIGSSGINYAIWALIVWYSSRLVMHYNVKGGTAFNAGFAILRGGLCFGKCLSNLKPFGEAVSIAQRMNAVIDGRRMIGMEDDGEEMAAAVVKGEVEFREVRFAYPASPETEVIKGLNLKIGEGKTVALVGGSGAGKSTVIALLQRFYEPTGGEILFDGVEMRRLRVKWVRAQMGLVSQEPVLFSMSIKENILFGKETATMDDVVAAAGAANATGFIAQLPQGYDTQTSRGHIGEISAPQAKDPLDSPQNQASDPLASASVGGGTEVIPTPDFARLSLEVPRHGRDKILGNPPPHVGLEEWGVHDLTVDSEADDSAGQIRYSPLPSPRTLDAFLDSGLEEPKRSRRE
ncbi:putative multidrug resistance protein [Platanthera zijinensis]|uniref:Multidrug resistance protein n=1 Tax=Platanthera zijinensis TaxID=2320716 RepID=A0AAP0B6D1_9ASPA